MQHIFLMRLRKNMAILLALNLLILFGCSTNNTGDNDLLAVAGTEEENEESIDYKLKNMPGVMKFEAINEEMFNNGEKLLSELSKCREELAENPGLSELKVYGMSQFKQNGKNIQYYVLAGEENINATLDMIESQLENNDTDSDYRGAHKKEYNSLLKLEPQLQSKLNSCKKSIESLTNSIKQEKSKDLQSLEDRYNQAYETRMIQEENLEKEVNKFKESLLSTLNSFIDSGDRDLTKDDAEVLCIKKWLLSFVKELHTTEEEFLDEEKMEENNRAPKWIKRAIARLSASVARLNVEIKQCQFKIETLERELRNIREIYRDQARAWEIEIEKMNAQISEFDLNYKETLTSRKKIIIAGISSEIKKLGLTGSKAIYLLAKIYDYLQKNELATDERFSQEDICTKKVEVLWGENEEEKDLLSLIIPENISQDMAIVAVYTHDGMDDIQVIPING